MRVKAGCFCEAMIVFLVILFMLSACGRYCAPFDQVEAASVSSYDPGRSPPLLPFNAWVKNETLEKALLEAVEAGGVERIVSQYRLQCSPHPTPADCVDCYACTQTLPMRFYSGPFVFQACHGYGEMLIRADVGPGSAVSVTTFWKK